MPKLPEKRWGDPSPMPPDRTVFPRIARLQPGGNTDESILRTASSAETRDGDEENFTDTNNFLDEDFHYDPLPSQSIRTALILDRFSKNSPIVYCSNDNFVSTTTVMGRPLFDFVVPRQEELVRSWIDAVKGWGVNERGQPSDGGFGYGKFLLYRPGRNSRSVLFHVL